MPTFEVEFEVDATCAVCRRSLTTDATTRERGYRREVTVEVAPCQHCLDQAREEGAE